uniref:Uncharacterized protein n=1 Tax=viral metagenome TaxID=1070528 RepID=A0A6M3L7B0_9ZZZZ
MAKRPVTELKTSPTQDVNNPSLELVYFITQSVDGDYYDCKKLTRIKGAFATNLTTDSKEIKVSWAVQGNGIARVTIVPEAGEELTTGYLVIIGYK